MISRREIEKCLKSAVGFPIVSPINGLIHRLTDDVRVKFLDRRVNDVAIKLNLLIALLSTKST
jgi:hypothetical protein